MKNISLLFFASTLLVLTTACSSHSSKRVELAPQPPYYKTATFPNDWEGTWAGALQIFNTPGDPVQVVNMTLHIAETDDPMVWDWQIRYGDQQARPYSLVIEDAGAGRFFVDENNSIVLPARLLGDTLTSRFAVMGNALTSTYQLGRDQIVFTIITSPTEGSPTGGENGVPEVMGYTPDNAQRAVLERVAN